MNNLELIKDVHMCIKVHVYELHTDYFLKHYLWISTFLLFTHSYFLKYDLYLGMKTYSKPSQLFALASKISLVKNLSIVIDRVLCKFGIM